MDAIFQMTYSKAYSWMKTNKFWSPKFVPMGQINNIPSLVQVMAWHRPDDKLLSEPMMESLLTHICIYGLNDLINMV